MVEKANCPQPMIATSLCFFEKLGNKKNPIYLAVRNLPHILTNVLDMPNAFVYRYTIIK